MPPPPHAVLTGPTTATIQQPVNYDGSQSTAHGPIVSWELQSRPQTDPLPSWEVVASGTGTPPAAIPVTFVEAVATQLQLIVTDKHALTSSADLLVAVS